MTDRRRRGTDRACVCRQTRGRRVESRGSNRHVHGHGVVCGNDVTFDSSAFLGGVSLRGRVAGAGYLSDSNVVLVTGCVS